MCCLRYEYDAYKDFKQRAPKVGTPVDFPDGSAGRISAHHVPRELLTVRQQGGPELTVPLEALDCSAGRGCPCKLRADAMPEPETAATLMQGTVPTLREADRPAEGQQTQQRQPRRKRSGEKAAPPKADAAKTSGQGTKGRSKDRNPKPKQGPAPAEAGQQQPPAGSSTRRRRRRRPRSDGGNTVS